MRKNRSLETGHSTSSNMWLPIALFVLVGVAAADYNHAWQPGTEYQYLVRSRTFTGLGELSPQYTGILIKALLTVQPQDEKTLRARVSNAQYANVHKHLAAGWESEISDQMLDLQDLPISEKPFEIKMKHGTIREMNVNKDVSTWEVNLLKSIVSQLQVDTQGENTKRTQSTQIPEDDESYASFKSMEDSVSGNCEVLYDITPLQDHVLQNRPELVPMPELKGDGQHLDIIKSKNFDNCDQRMHYHFGITEKTKWEPGSNSNGKFLSRSSTSRVVISGNLKRFTIQSSVTTSKMFVSPRFYDSQSGMVGSRMNLTLAKVNENPNPLAAPENPESTGNLVYLFNNPFAETQQRKPGRPSISPNSKQEQDSGSRSAVSSSEENDNAHEHNHGHNHGHNSHGDENEDKSASSSASSSSISSSEKNDFWQAKPTLEAAPDSPLLPYFVGYMGKAIGKSNKIDPVQSAKELVQEIANEAEDPSSIPTQQTLEKFTILSSLIRTMNRRQIEEAENNMHVSANDLKGNDKSQARKQNAWAVFRDAVTQAGTGPALMTIKNWIEKRKVEGMEAAEIVSRIPKNARTPTAQYVRALFDMATNPQVMKQELVNSTAIFAFAELVRQSQISNSSIHNRYPVHTFGRLSSKHDNTVLEEYIPFLSQQLKNAVKDGDSPRIQTYILALGAIGHPKILSVFEPYIEGKQQVTDFQRLMMVSALSKLAELKPRLTRSVLYKIYLNTRETHEVRCMAVFLLMKTNPPMNMLQRMAEFTNFDSNKHVNSVVKSVIKNAAGLSRPEQRDMANRARSVRKLLNPKIDDSYQYSQAFYMDRNINEDNIATKFILAYIGSNNGRENLIPPAWYASMETMYGDFNAPATEASGMISSMKALFDMYRRTRSEDDRSEKSPTEKIVEALNIQPESPVQVEGNLLWNSKYSTRFMPFDKHTIERITNMAAKSLQSLKNGKYVNMNQLTSYDVTLSFPTETGLPFVYTLRVPNLFKLSATAQYQNNDNNNVKAESAFRLVYSMKVQGRIGFVAPFEHQHFISGVDVNAQVHVPAKVQVDVNTAKKNVQLQLLPMKGEENARLLHYSVVPYTSKHNILNLRPVISDKNTYKVQSQDIVTASESIPTNNLKVLRINVEADAPKSGSQNIDSLSALFIPWNQDENKYYKFDMFMNLQKEQKEPVVLTASYDTKEVRPGSENPNDWKRQVKVIQAADDQPNSRARKEQFLNEAAKGIKSAQSCVVDLQLETPGEYKTRNGLTLAWAMSNVEDKYRALLYWASELPNQGIQNRVCAAGQAQTSPSSSLDYEKAIASRPMSEMNIDIRYGESCSEDGRVNIRAKTMQTEQLNKKVQQSKQAKQCQEQMKHGNKALRACRNAINAATTEDQLDMSIEFSSQPVQVVVNKAVDLLTLFDSANIDVTNPKNEGKKKIDIKMKVSNDLQKVNVDVHTSQMDLSFPPINLANFGMEGQNLLANEADVEMGSKADDIKKSTCTLDSTRAETFDDKSYPLRLGKCWHVAMTSYPKSDPNNPNRKLRIPEGSMVSILTRENEDGNKEVKIMLGNKEIRLSPSQNQPKASIDGRQIEASQEQSHQEKEDDEVAFEIFRLGDDSIGLTSDKYRIQLSYDGKRLLIQASDQYSNAVRGLCGNFDSDAENDFTAPQNCVLRKPEEFIASYALTKDQCEGPSLEIAQKAHKFQCRRQSKQLSNVISDRESGRTTQEGKNWGYHQHSHGHSHSQQGKGCVESKTKMETINGQLCFSINTVPSCAAGCNPTETTTKNYQFHCPSESVALALKKRIEKGAIPNMKGKSVSETKSIVVPRACAA